MSGRLDDVIAEPARRTGLRVGDMDDEHERWPVYQEAFTRSECSDLLFRAVALETDTHVALSIVLQMLGGIREPARPAWIAQLSREDGRDYAARRANDIGLFQSRAVTPLLGDADVQDSWSDWLQLLLAEFSEEPAVLRRLMEKGRTKRIRRYATHFVLLLGHTAPAAFTETSARGTDVAVASRKAACSPR